MTPLHRIVHEIHRRSLWQVLGIYLGASWIVFEVVQTLTEGLGLPDWLPAFALVLLLIGFPVVLATAFVQEEGRSGTKSLDVVPEESRLESLFTWRNAIVGGVMGFALWGVVAAGWLMFSGSRGIGSGTADNGAHADSVIPSIAVLPFENLSPDRENAFFADGIHEEILSQLAGISGLKVISRTSVLEFADREHNIPEIADRLGVSHVLEGSVRKAGDRVRITAQLIDAGTDTHLWSDSFEREYTIDGIFGIQTDIAERVVEEMEGRLTRQETRRLSDRPTEDLEAYEFYLRGNARFNWGYVERDIRYAIQMYEAAVERDPDFAVAHARLSRSHGDMYWFSHDRSPSRVELSRSALARAFDLAPDHPETRIAAGFFHYHLRLDYERALQEFEAARASRPNDPLVLSGIGYVQRRMGMLERAAENIREAVQRDPLSARFAFNLAETSQLLRRYDEAERWMERSIELAPEWPRPYGYLSLLKIQRDGALAEAREVLESARLAGVIATDDPFIPYSWILIDRLSGDFAGAVVRIESRGWRLIESQFFYLPADFILGELHRLDGDPEAARQAYERAEKHLLAQLDERPDDERVHSTLGRVYAGLGREDAALEHGRRGLDLLPVETEAYRGTFRIEDLAKIHAVLGRPDDASALLARLLARPSLLSPELLRLDSVWHPLRGHPPFQRLVNAAAPTTSPRSGGVRRRRAPGRGRRGPIRAPR